MFNLINKNTIFLSLSKLEKTTFKIAQELNCEYLLLKKKEFVNSEILISSSKLLINKNIIFVHSNEAKVNESLMELFISLDAIKRSGAKTINLVIPFLAYGRQDRQTDIGEPITSRMIIKLIESFNINKIITFDLHSEKTKSFFSDKLIELNFTNRLLIKFFKNKVSDLSLVSPDLGRNKQIEFLSEKLKLPIVKIFKIRHKDNDTKVQSIIGEVKDKNLLLIDDIIDTGNTLLNSINYLKKQGANNIYILATHGLFSKNAIEKFNINYKNKTIKKVFISDTLLQEKNNCLEIISISQCLIDFFKNVKDEKSLKLFLKEEELNIKNE